MSRPRIWQVLLAVAAILVAAVVAALFVPLPGSLRRQSPDGAFTAVVKTRLMTGSCR